jgi:hypothetical protein
MGKGDTYRRVDGPKYRANWLSIFRKPKKINTTEQNEGTKSDRKKMG